MDNNYSIIYEDIDDAISFLIRNQKYLVDGNGCFFKFIVSEDRTLITEGCHPLGGLTCNTESKTLHDHIKNNGTIVGGARMAVLDTTESNLVDLCLFSVKCSNCSDGPIVVVDNRFNGIIGDISE